MRLLMITVRADYGGGPEHVYNLIEHLPSTLEVFIACPKDKPYWERYCGLIGKQRMFEIPHRKFNIIKLIKLIYFIKKNRINIIHSHGKGGGLYGRILGICLRIPVIHTFHGLHIEEYSSLKKQMYILLEKTFSTFSETIIAVSNGEADLLIKNGMVPERKIKIIPNGVKIPLVNHDSPQKTKEHIVLSITRFDYQKNSELIIPIIQYLKSVKRLDEFCFFLLGTGPGKTSLEESIINLGFENKVIFTGTVDKPSKLISQCFCYLSTSRWEGMPLAVLEAMAYGKPVVASSVVGNKDLIQHNQNGFLFDIKSPEEAANFLIRLADNKDLREVFTTNAIKMTNEKYSVERMANETSEVYRQQQGK